MGNTYRNALIPRFPCRDLAQTSFKGNQNLLFQYCDLALLTRVPPFFWEGTRFSFLLKAVFATLLDNLLFVFNGDKVYTLKIGEKKWEELSIKSKVKYMAHSG